MYTDNRSNEPVPGPNNKSGYMKVEYNLDVWGPIDHETEEQEDKNVNDTYYYYGQGTFYDELHLIFNNIPTGESSYDSWITMQYFYKTNGGSWEEEGWWETGFGPYEIVDS